jgi:hypothetical protein
MLEKRFGDAALIHAEQQLMGDEVPAGSTEALGSLSKALHH